MLMGTAIGASVPRYEDATAANRGDEVRLTSSRGQEVSGTVMNNDGHDIAVSRVECGRESSGEHEYRCGPQPPVDVPLNRISRIDRRVGNHSARGAGIGALIDVGVFVATVIGGSIWLSSSFSGWGGGF